MAAVSSPLSVYTRRVSFNNLDTDKATEPQGLPVHPYAGNVENTGHHQGSLGSEFSKLFGNYSLSGALSGGNTVRKRIRLPQPPLKLILKNKLTSAQLETNSAWAAAQNELSPINATFGAENEMDGSSSESEDKAPPPTVHRNLFSGMTDEELSALDPQFSKQHMLNMDLFRFDSVTTYYSPSRRGSTANISALVVSAAANKVVYSSLNENNYKSISLTLKHQDYDYENTSNRTLLTVISGRKHTWNSLDWLLLTEKTLRSNSFLQNGDYLVVAAMVPYKYLEAGAKSHQKKKSLEESLRSKCDLILRYILDNLADALIRLRITVELVIDVPPPSSKGTTGKNTNFGTKLMISHLYKQYNPSLVILGNRSTNLNFKYPLRIRNSMSLATAKGATPSPGPRVERETTEFLIKLSSYMVKYSTVPVILVGNATLFHKFVTRKQLVSVKFYGTPLQLWGILDGPPVNFSKNSAVSDNSIESFTGGAFNDEHSVTPDLEVKTELDHLMNSTSEDRFAAMILAVSQASLSDLNNYLQLICDDSVDWLSPEITSSRVHQAYASTLQAKLGPLLLKTSSGTSVYRVKSLILYSEEDEKKNERRLSKKKLRKSISGLSSVSLGSGKDEKKKKRSFLLRIGLKKS
ncbi:hypothetical protein METBISCDRAFT_26455 [Metschnikowia bicuspidata]|uniref:Uncharacterized protein n=1 Tax=Metschnikowia bicuspidata TaxID=27322 RepID=A0A4P9ZH80_9ASCO|nr:hypothetical protein METBISCDRAFT_26455 [Metschnikowia bicuspidata]